jgi:TetR/AcrR family transcriptional regulator, lmrAB and yxaGH operons repressor
VTEDSRTKMVQSAASLIASHGVTATSFSEVLADSGAPRGSIYHHFPDGKKQLAHDAISWTSERVLGYLRACPAGSGSDILRSFIGLWRQVVESSSGSSGCAVAGVAVDTVAADDPELLGAVQSTFRDWVTTLAERLQTAGVPAARATPIAVAALAGMEGALILCRAEGSSGPLETIAQELMRLLPIETGPAGSDADPMA